MGSGGAKMMQVGPTTALRAQGTPSGCRWAPSATARRTGRRPGGLLVPEEEAAHGPSPLRRRSFVRPAARHLAQLILEDEGIGRSQQHIASWGALAQKKFTYSPRRQMVPTNGRRFDVATSTYRSGKPTGSGKTRRGKMTTNSPSWSLPAKRNAERHRRQKMT